MPIINLQKRLSPGGRIRIGQQVDALDKNGKPLMKDGKQVRRPAKLEKFRLTTANERNIRSAAAFYGGEVTRWDDAPVGEQWELFTDTTELPVLVPPTEMAFSQWMELWSGGGCVRRCDSQHEFLSDGPCLCDPAEPECKPHTRLSVILTDLQGLGVWRLDTSGWNAATELSGASEVARMAAARGRMIPARLLLEQRVSKKIVNGNAATRKFAVPVLDLDIDFGELAALQRGDGAPAVLDAVKRQLMAPADPPTGLTPVPPPCETEAPTIAEQAQAVAQPAPAKRTARSAEPIKPTGLAPRSVSQAQAQEQDAPKAADDDATRAATVRAKQLHIYAHEISGDYDPELLLDAAIRWVTQDRTESASAITQREANHVTALLNAFHLGKTEVSDHMIDGGPGHEYRFPESESATVGEQWAKS